MPLSFIRCVSAALVVVLTTAGCGTSFEELRSDSSSWASPPRPAASRSVLPEPSGWSSAVDDLDETIVVIPNAPRKVRVPEVTPEEFREFIRDALRDVDLARLRAELLPPPSSLRLASALQVPKSEFDISRGYSEWCNHTERPGSCIELPTDRPYLTDLQKYRVALRIGMSQFVDGFYNELGAEVRATLSRETFISMIVGAMVSYLALLANPDPIFTKALAAAATMVLTAELGARTVCDLVFGFRDMIQQVDVATTFAEIARAGARYGELIGAATARILVMAVTALFNRGGGISKLLNFPKLRPAMAAVQMESGGALKAINQVVGVRALKSGLYVAMATAGGKDASEAKTPEATSPPTSAPAPVPAPQEPVTLPEGVVGYKSFTAFKAAQGSAGKGLVWHHIVEKCREDIFGPAAVHNRWNIIKLDEETHLKVNGYYSSKSPVVNGGQTTVREWLKTQSYEVQREFGLGVLRKLGDPGR